MNDFTFTISQAFQEAENQKMKEEIASLKARNKTFMSAFLRKIENEYSKNIILKKYGVRGMLENYIKVLKISPSKCTAKMKIYVQVYELIKLSEEC